jgi:hypothetical protein
MYDLLSYGDLKVLEKYICEEIRCLEDEQAVVQDDSHLAYGVDECRITLRAIRQLLLNYNESIF